MKKLYIQPQTESLELMGEHLCDEMVAGSEGKSKDGVWSNAPSRKANIMYI